MKEIDEIHKKVDSLGSPKAVDKPKKKMSKTLKTVGAIGIVCMMCTIAVAALIPYFAKFDTKVTVTQAIKVDGFNYDHEFTSNIEDLEGGCCICDGPHVVTNDGCEPVWLDFETFEVSDPQNPGPIPEGITVKAIRCPEEEPEPEPCYLELLTMSALDGINENTDDFEVYVDDVLVYTYDAVGGGQENWVTHTIDLLTPASSTPGTGIAHDPIISGTNTVKIICTSSMWQYFNPYGQLGIDSVALYYDCPTCPEPQLCGSVDIGYPTSEAAVTMNGWGPIEPATHGGNWGGIANCRATWFYGNPQTDTSEATITFTCPSCSQPGEATDGKCDCSDPEMGPFEIMPGESISFCICYGADILVGPGSYTFQTKLVPAAA